MTDVFRPGVRFVRDVKARVAGPPVDPRTTFMVGITESGPDDKAVLVRSLAEYEAAFGRKGTHSGPMADSVAAFFQWANAPLVVARVADAKNDGNPADKAWQDALDLLGVGFGPGQVLAPGQTSTPRHKQLMAHANAANRIAFLDLAKGVTDTQAKQAVTAVAGASGVDRAGFFARWGVQDAVSVPASVLAAVQTTKVDTIANVQPIEAQVGAIRGATVPETTDKSRTDLYANGVNVVLDTPNGLVLGGYRSADLRPSSMGADLAAARLMMWMEAEFRAIARQYVGAPITSTTVAAFHGATSSVLARVYAAGGLYGDTPVDAYQVNTRDVNTPESAARRELNVQVHLRIAEHVELVTIHAVNVPVTETI